MRLQDKVAIITGGGAGIGRAIAEHFAREGARVVIAEINSANGEATVAAILAAGGAAIFARTDVAQTADVEALVAAAIERYGRVDVLCNNAAIQLFGQDTRAHELSEQAWDRTHAVNLRAVWLCSKYIIPVMLRQGGGAIINIASPTGLRAAPPYTAYSASKGGVIALTRTMAIDYARDNIRVNAIVPGMTDTPLLTDLLTDAERRAYYADRLPMGRLGTPEDVAPLAVFLASDQARYCLGGLYMVDGGMTAL